MTCIHARYNYTLNSSNNTPYAVLVPECVPELCVCTHAINFHVHAGQGSDQSKDFKRKLTPCCNRIHPTGYCGQRSASGEALYNLCQNPDNFFYWDEIHPTNAGWKAVMTALEQPLKEFLDRDYVH